MKEINIYFGRITKHGQIIENSQFLEFLEHIINPIFTSYTIFPCIGFWDRKKEPSTMIQLITDNVDDIMIQNIENICKKYCEMWYQDCVLVTQKDVYSQLYGNK